jgi:uncharacterized protein YaaN involved in tellurite resistance
LTANIKKMWNKLNENRFKLNRDIKNLESERDRLQKVNEKLDLQIQVKTLSEQI